MRSPSANDEVDEALVDEAMSRWLRLHSGEASPREAEAFERWRRLSTAHRRASEEAELLWRLLEMPAHRLAASQPQNDDRCGPFGDGNDVAREVRTARWIPAGAGGSRVHRPSRWAAVWLAGMIAVLVLAPGVGLWRDPGMTDRLMADLSTSTGQILERRLEDGTSLYLGMDSAANIDLSGATRKVVLRRGRLWLHVAHDGRPFVVHADNARVRVMGTRFAVEQADGGVQVTVAEGVVSVKGDGSSRATVLRQGDRVWVGPHGELRESEIDPNVALAWVRGRVVFDRADIATVAAQLERMTPGRVLYDADRFADLRLSGSFPADDPQPILSALAEAMDVKVDRLPGWAIWLRR